MLPDLEHRESRYLNKRAENSHRPTWHRERQMQWFKSMHQAQRQLKCSLGRRGSVLRTKYSGQIGTGVARAVVLRVGRLYVCGRALLLLLAVSPAPLRAPAPTPKSQRHQPRRDACHSRHHHFRACLGTPDPAAPSARQTPEQIASLCYADQRMPDYEDDRLTPLWRNALAGATN